MIIKPLSKNIFAVLEQGERKTASGIIIRDDNGKQEGIRPRWAKVWKVADDVTDVSPGQWILVEHGRWTMNITVKDENGDNFVFNKIDPAGILAVQDEAPHSEDVMFGDVFDSSAPAHKAEDFGAR